MCSLCDKHTSSFLLSVNLFVLKIILPILPSIQTKRLSVGQFTLSHCHVSFVNEQYAMFHLHSSILTTLKRPEITAAVVFN